MRLVPVQTRKRRPGELRHHPGVTAEPQRDQAGWTAELLKRDLSQRSELLGMGGLCRSLGHSFAQHPSDECHREDAGERRRATVLG